MSPTDRRTASLDRLFAVLVARRYLVLLVAAVGFWLHGHAVTDGVGRDWHYFVDDSKAFSSVRDLGVYVGPLALVIARPFASLSLTTGWAIVSAACMLLSVLSLRFVEDAAASTIDSDPVRREQVVLVGGLFALYALSQPAVIAGHVDDVVTLTLVTFALRAVARGNWWVASLAIAGAIESKPWGWLVLPLAASCEGRRLRGLALTVVFAVLPWLPYVLAVHGSLATQTLNLGVSPYSGAHLLGAGFDSYPSWPRYVQLLLAFGFGGVAAMRGRWYLIPVVGFAIRVALDPATFLYYQAEPVLGLLIWDVFRPVRRLPGIRTAIGCILLINLPGDAEYLHLVGSGYGYFFATVRLLIAAAVVAAVLVRQRQPAAEVAA